MGAFIGEGSVRVPVRDQIYDPFGEPVDPYGQAKCSVCNGATDECLLLLCDLCDSASHTYCVGLGATVPEGDWYCRDCALLRAEQLESEIGDNVNTSIVSPHFDESSTSASVSIFDIVRDPINSKKPDSGTDRLRKLVSRQPTKFSSSAIASDQPIVSSARTGARGNLHSSVDSPESSARTLQNCRNVHRHINVLRENWGAFRTGSLSFSLTFSDSFGKASQKKNAVGTQAERSSKSQFRSSLQSKAGDSLHDATREKESYNVDRAWKLMTKAKTVHQTAESKKNFQNKAHSSQINKFVPKCVVSGRKDLISPRIMKLKPTDKMSGRPAESSVDHQFTSFTSLTATACGSKHQKFCVPNLSVPREMELASKYSMYHNRTCFAPSKKLKRRETMIFDGSGWSESSCGPIAGTPDVSCARLQKKESLACPAKQAGPLDICSLSKRELQTSVIADICRDKTGLLSYANLGRRCISDEQNGFPCSTSSHEPIVGGSDASHVRLEGRKIPACQGEVRAKITSKGSKYDETKGEIQSLVKLNLKLLCKDKRLGVDAFKEIARLSTHTVLASCGFEHREIVRSCPTLVCHHGDQTQHCHRSTIVPSSCRECFYAFVKDVVNSIMSEKLNSVEVAS